MWWCRDSITGTKGRVYYSPEGRPEAVQGFVNASTDDNPTKKLIIWNEQLYCFTENKLYRCFGTTEPFEFKEVFGAPGTKWPHTVVGTPFGIVYRSDDGIRLFNGSSSSLIDIDAIYPIFRGENAENLNSFAGVVATFARNEYIISDGSQTLAHDLAHEAKSWRDLGLGCNSLYYEDDSGEIIASFSSKVCILEDEGVTSGDDSVGVAFAVEFPSVRTNSGQYAVVQMIHIEMDANAQSITPTLLIDGTEVTLPTLVPSTKEKIELPINRPAKLIGLRLTGTLTDRVEIACVEADIYVPANENRAAS
jgi:hypothetical protein